MKNNIAISTRVRLARNYSDLPFIAKMTQSDAQAVLSRVKLALAAGERKIGPFDFYTMDQLTRVQKQALVEKHLISPSMINFGAHSGVCISRDETVSILLNEEDHIRIQVLKNGYDLKGAMKTANLIDDLLEQDVSFAFDEEFGYLTACPTNAGTGLRASVMLHLPALTLLKQAGPVLNAAGKLGIVSRGLYGEGSEAIGNFYQISNQITLGITEEQAVDKLSRIVGHIMEKEAEAAKALRENIAVQDKIYRSYGILQNARILSAGEYMNLISDVRLGAHMGILPEIDMGKINRLLVSLQPANLMLEAKEDLSAQQRDERRAKCVREELFCG